MSEHPKNTNTIQYINSFPALILAALFKYKEAEYLSYDDVPGLHDDPDIKKLF